MDGVGSAGSRQQDFNRDELEAMRQDPSTSEITNRARRDAGFKEKDLGVRGDDRTLDQVLHERRSHAGKGEMIAGSIHAFEIAEAAGAFEGGRALHAMKAAPHVVLPIAALAAAHYNMIEMERAKAEMKDGATRDQMHAAILQRLDVPAGYKDEEMKRLNVTNTAQSASSKIRDRFDDHGFGATLQLHCDQGMNTARDMIDAGQTKDAYLKAHPKAAERYASDAAFHNGFDALVWAKKDSTAEKGNAASYTNATKDLDSRDARYERAHVTYRL